MKLKEIKDNAKKYIELCKLLYKDSRTPKITKILFGLSQLCIITNRFKPDFIPVIGHLDDIVILPVLLYIAIKSVPKDVYIENYVKILKK